MDIDIMDDKVVCELGLKNKCTELNKWMEIVSLLRWIEEKDCLHEKDWTDCDLCEFHDIFDSEYPWERFK